MTAPATLPDARREHPGRPCVVVGVDGTIGNLAAVEYAAYEALDCGRPLTMLLVVDDDPFAGTPDSPQLAKDEAWESLVHLSEEVGRDHPGLDIRCEIRAGSAAYWLVERSLDHNGLVVGRRGLGPFGRLFLGSTSFAVAARSHVPVVVVPTDWERDEHLDAPVVVGVDLHDPHSLVTLDHAFQFAQRRRVWVRVVPALNGGPMGLRGGSVPSPQDLPELLAPIVAGYPTVDVEQVPRRRHQWASALIEESEHAQLLVIGRRPGNRAGRVPRSAFAALLHRATIPVAVVPASS